jgi:hypothetical protein
MTISKGIMPEEVDMLPSDRRDFLEELGVWGAMEQPTGLVSQAGIKASTVKTLPRLL